MAMACIDCVDGRCVMNCGPAIPNTTDRIARAIKALRTPDQTLARVPNTIRQSLAEVIEGLQRDKAAADAAYLERNRLVALLASMYPSGVARTDIPGWLPEWHGCVYIDLPTGQVSWHYHDDHAHMFANLPPYTKQWDGHTTDEKYQRVSDLALSKRVARQIVLKVS